jgi:hypothetical protein
MIDLIYSYNSKSTADLVLAAFRRSVTRSQARLIAPGFSDVSNARILVAINPDATQAAYIRAWKAKGSGKLILLGSLDSQLMQDLGLKTTSWPETPIEWSRSTPAPSYSFAESPARIVYTAHSHSIVTSKKWERPLERFDFTDEWNNLGYGAIRHDGSPWALSMPLIATTDSALANIVLDNQVIATYAVLHEDQYCSTLWFNRETGPIDSFEWRLIENFIASWRHTELPCQPVLTDIPWGCDAAVTMRLDCDEDIESARALRAAYHAMNVPFSLAVHTKNLQDPAQHKLLQEMATAGESILSHTATHAPNWGGSYEAARHEGMESKRLIEAITGQPVHYAVSPFHQSPPYALAGLADAGLMGCIGGIIRNDPEFLIARGGTLANLPEGFIGHSQQHMLHGDCLLENEDPIAISRQAFDRAFETGTLFGYLDHPFSARYQYGWSDEETRINTHCTFIAHMQSKGNVLFLSETDAMDFLLHKSQLDIIHIGEQFFLCNVATTSTSKFKPAIEYQSQRVEATLGLFAI